MGTEGYQSTHRSPLRKGELIAMLGELIKMIRLERAIPEETKGKLINNFDRIREELGEEESPDTTRIEKWLCNNRKLLKVLEPGQPTMDLVRWVYESFGQDLY